MQAKEGGGVGVDILENKNLFPLMEFATSPYHSRYTDFPNPAP
jgi:hypothetical protein